jgi:putative ABC transport system permease protein
MLQKNFDGFATNSAMVWSQTTTKPYKGFKKGRWWNMTDKDVVRLKSQVPELDIVAPVLFCGSKAAVHEDQNTTASVRGVTNDYARVNEPLIFFGRYLNEMDMKQNRKVCVIGKKVYQDLFPKGGDPCGTAIRIDSIYYEVVGVDYRTGDAINIGGRADESVMIPISVVRKAYNRGNRVDMIALTGKGDVKMGSLTTRIRQTIAREHLIDPNDEQGVMVFNTEVLFGIMDSLFKGVNFLIWLVGIGTLLAGAIGVSNIMMVTVKERTTEIGIRRAIGAQPKDILQQILSESMVLTSIAGMAGISFGVFVLNILETAANNPGDISIHYQVSFGTAIGTCLLLIALGVLAGLAPAYRAMAIKPIEAIRDE